jgi:hypothetical protein
VFHHCEPSYYLIQSPSYHKVLTGVLPFGDSEANWINDITLGKRPPRPEDPSQNQWLQDRIWDMITTCWSNELQQRCELSVVYYVFSTPSPQDLLVEFPPVGHKNLLQLVKELLYTFLVLPLAPGQRATLRTVQKYISDVISREGSSPTTPLSVKAAALAEAFHEVCFPH